MRPHRPVDLGHALQRALVQALAKLAAALAQADMSEADVHRARRAAKRARALARLAPGALAAHAQRTIEIARQARRGLGGPRDAAVRRATLAKLRKRLGPAHERLAGALDDPAPPAPGDRDGLRIALGALIHEWRAATMSDAGDEILRRVTKGYRKARRRAPHHGASAQELHRWRAAVVDHEYQTDFLKDCSRFAARQSDSADELRRRLGDAHDIDALLGFAEASEDAALSGSHEALAAAAAPRRNKRAVAARRLGEKMFRRKPRKWAKRFRRSVLPSDG